MTTQPPAPAAGALPAANGQAIGAYTLEERREALGILAELVALGGRLAFEIRHGDDWRELRQIVGLPSQRAPLAPEPYALAEAWKAAYAEALEFGAFEVLELLLQPNGIPRPPAAAAPLERDA